MYLIKAMKKLFAILLVISCGVFFSCKKEHSLPAPKSPPAESGKISVDSIIRKFVSYYVTSVPLPTKHFRFPDDVNLYCTVTADETNGNIYKSVYVEDNTGGLKINLINGYGLNVGDRIRINLNGVLLNSYGSVVQLDSIDIEKRVVKISSGNPVTPVKVTFNQIKSTVNGLSIFQSRLVILDSVEFAPSDKGQSFADTSIYKFTLERTLLNSFSSPVIVRTSGYANFAKASIPCGKGSVVAIVGQYYSTIQLTIRSLKDVNLTTGNCPLLIKHFNDGSITSGGWTNYNVTGNINWTYDTYNEQKYARISNYVSGNVACETWLISPPFDISNAPSPRFFFQSAYNYSGPALQALVSTNYSGGNPNAATWTVLNPVLSPGSWVWLGSGNISLSSFKSPATRVAFKYTGTSSAGSTWEIDDIAVFSE